MILTTAIARHRVLSVFATTLLLLSCAVIPFFLATARRRRGTEAGKSTPLRHV